MKKPSRLDYAYSVGRVRALETSLIPKAVFWEVAEEKDFLNALKVLFDAGAFLDEKAEIQGSEELDEFIANEERSLYGLISRLMLEKDIFKVIRAEDHPEKALSIAMDTGYPFIRDYFRHKIDLGNLKIFSRLKYAGLLEDKLEKLMLKGGFLDVNILLQSMDLSYTEVGEKFHATHYQKIWNRAVDSLEEKETFVEMERGFEDFLMNYLQKAKYIVFGPEPVFAYALARKRELNLVRLLGVGKMSQIPAELLKERISDTYV